MFERQEFLETVETASVVVTIAAEETAGVQLEEVSVQEAWERVRRRLRAELGEDVFSSWFGRLELAGIVEGVAYLTVPTRFLKSWLEAHYAERLRVNCIAEPPAPNGVLLSVRQVSRDASIAAPAP